MRSSFFRRKRVTVFPSAQFDNAFRLLEGLSELFPVEFVRSPELGPEQIDAAIFFPEAWEQSCMAFERGVSSFRFAGSSKTVTIPGHLNVTFLQTPILHPAFRGAQVPLGSNTAVAERSLEHRDITLASQGPHAIWQFRADRGLELHTSFVAPPTLQDRESMASHLSSTSWVALFPLLHFLRGVTADIDWRPTPAQACFIFDDPNLHLARYGYLDFAELAEESAVHNYHIAFATVPLDTFYAAPKAVRLFHSNKSRLSLVIHGNNHTKGELRREYPGEEGLRLLAQALRRIGRFEIRTGLKVSRVMVPPHRAGCSDILMAQMLRLPFEGVCTSVNSVVSYCESRRLLPDFGISPTAFLAGGCPVVRRSDLKFGLTPLRLAAFLGQPIIPYGHSQDCAEGVNILAEVADAVNSWGPTKWTDMQSVLRSQFRTRLEGDVMQIEMRSRRVRVPIPPTVSWISLHAPKGVNAESCMLNVSSDTASGCGVFSWGDPYPTSHSAFIDVCMQSVSAVDPSRVPRPTYQIWPPIRRALNLIRDRAPQFLPKAAGQRHTGILN